VSPVKQLFKAAYAGCMSFALRAEVVVALHCRAYADGTESFPVRKAADGVMNQV
jgi:organic hydroperoxide reductase OsmC/OhrA